jgi:hypothetical protein
MGFESFRVELGGGPKSSQEADATIRKIPGVERDSHSITLQGSTYYVWTDGRHLIELELTDDPVSVSCRFTLCHPASVDPAYLALVRQLMLQLETGVFLCDDVRPEHANSFSLDRFDEFASAAGGYIAARRAEWVHAFGNDQMAANTDAVCDWLIRMHTVSVTV